MEHTATQHIEDRQLNRPGFGGRQREFEEELLIRAEQHEQAIVSPRRVARDDPHPRR